MHFIACSVFYRVCIGCVCDLLPFGVIKNNNNYYYYYAWRRLPV